MGMNYYLREKSCKLCGCAPPKKHIGKASHGWRFTFRGYPDEGIVSYLDWLREISKENYEIVDENDRVMDKHEFTFFVEHRISGLSHYNTAFCLPMTEKEKEHCKDRRHFAQKDMQYAWKDDEGHPFTSQVFS